MTRPPHQGRSQQWPPGIQRGRTQSPSQPTVNVNHDLEAAVGHPLDSKGIAFGSIVLARRGSFITFVDAIAVRARLVNDPREDHGLARPC